MESAEIKLREDFIKLGQALKAAGLVGTGAEAKAVILDGKVRVNKEVCLQRGKKLCGGDEVLFENTRLLIKAQHPDGLTPASQQGTKDQKSRTADECNGH